MDFREQHPQRFMDLDYRELVEDPMAAVARIHAFVDEPLGRLSRKRMLEWAEENARDRRPIHRYTLEQFGLSEAGLARDFQRYRTRFLADALPEHEPEPTS
jgi:LPS sulfotransferase NodH